MIFDPMYLLFIAPAFLFSLVADEQVRVVFDGIIRAGWQVVAVLPGPVREVAALGVDRPVMTLDLGEVTFIEGQAQCFEKLGNLVGGLIGAAAWTVVVYFTDYELGVIISMGYAAYFLIVADFIRFAKDEQLTPEALHARLDGIPVPIPLAEMGCEIYTSYQRALLYRGAVDFDDLAWDS